MESDKINQELKKKIMDRDDVILALRAQLDALNKTLQQLREMSNGSSDEFLNLQAKYGESMNMNLMLQE